MMQWVVDQQQIPVGRMAKTRQTRLSRVNDCLKR